MPRVIIVVNRVLCVVGVIKNCAKASIGKVCEFFWEIFLTGIVGLFIVSEYVKGMHDGTTQKATLFCCYGL